MDADRNPKTDPLRKPSRKRGGSPKALPKGSPRGSPKAAPKEFIEEADKPAKQAKKAKTTEGPYTKYREVGRIPEPLLPRRDASAHQRQLNVVVWNVGGLRSFLHGRVKDLQKLADCESPDVIGILEIKLQEGDTDTSDALLQALPGYKIAAMHCSTAKKGYSGVAVLTRNDSPQPLKIERSDLPIASDEGRIVSLEYESLHVVVAYVPNSGDGLKRLNDRINKWDVEFRTKLTTFAQSKATMLIGDLNVAHLDADIWNVEAPHVPRSAGTTPQERGSFSLLLDAGFVDGFRHFHPEALGAFTYWSVRAGNRPKNRGLRLDYAVVSKDMTANRTKDVGPFLVDVFHMPELSTGDHCPVGALIAM